MKLSSSQSPASSTSSRHLLVLAAGDIGMLFLFVIIGRISHGMTSDWLVNVVRIATPFLAGWAVASWITGAYRAHLWQTPRVFMARSAFAWLLADGVAFLLRRYAMQDRITIPFALTSIAFTGLFLLAWRLVFLIGRTAARRGVSGDDTHSLTM